MAWTLAEGEAEETLMEGADIVGVGECRGRCCSGDEAKKVDEVRWRKERERCQRETRPRG